MVGYVTTAPAFVRGKLGAREVSSFCDFREMTSCDFTAFSQFVLKQTFVF